MTSRIAVLAVDAHDPAALADFWCQVLGFEVLEQEDGNLTIGAAGASAWFIDLLQVPAAKTTKNRLHLDLRADDTTTEAELARLLTLGARRVDVGQEPDVSWTVLADPEGNEFCLLSRTVQEMTVQDVGGQDVAAQGVAAQEVSVQEVAAQGRTGGPPA